MSNHNYHHNELQKIYYLKVQRSLDTLIGTQKVRRIGPEIIQNNTSHTELPELPDNVKELLDKI